MTKGSEESLMDPFVVGIDVALPDDRITGAGPDADAIGKTRGFVDSLLL